MPTLPSSLPILVVLLALCGWVSAASLLESLDETPQVAATLSNANCTPTIMPQIAQTGFCVSTDLLNTECSASGMEISQSADCQDFVGSWCCYTPPPVETKVALDAAIDNVTVTPGSTESTAESTTDGAGRRSPSQADSETVSEPTTESPTENEITESTRRRNRGPSADENSESSDSERAPVQEGNSNSSSENSERRPGGNNDDSESEEMPKRDSEREDRRRPSRMEGSESSDSPSNDDGGDSLFARTLSARKL